MTLKELEARVQTLEDIEAIKRLQRAYGYYMEHQQAEEIIGLFSQSPDASMEVNDWGLYKGKAIQKFLSNQANPPSEFLHLFMPLSGIVDVDPDGKTAKGRWYVFGCLAIPTEGEVQAKFESGIWENEYVKENGKWKFKRVLYKNIFSTPYEDGWVKTPRIIRPLPQDRPAPSPNNVYAPYPSGYIFPYHYKNPVTGK